MALALPALGAAGDPSIAKAKTVRPEATGQFNGVSAVLMAEDDLVVGQKIVTGAQGQVEIVFADDTHLVVGPGSSLLIEKYLMRNGGTASSFAVSALGGTFRFITGNSQKSAYRINTPTATIGVRGTKFDFAVDKKTHKTTIWLFDGEVSLCPTTGGCKTVSGQCEVGLAEASNAKLIGADDSRQSSVTSAFPYVSSQRGLSNDFRVKSANRCGGSGEAESSAKQPEPTPEPKPDPKPAGKPDPVPDPLPDSSVGK